ncbi:MAG: Ig-like domain-containing protein [Planctomycetota bacterium]|nr:Ig-like domain-containing protein [Planctomycetota bacterium]
MSRLPSRGGLAGLIVAGILAAAPGSWGAAAPADGEEPKPARLDVQPTALELGVGDTARLEAKVLDATGKDLTRRIVFFSLDRRSVTVDRSGKVTARRPGEFTVVVMMPAENKEERLRVEVAVSVAYSPLAGLEFVEPRGKVYRGTTVSFRVRALEKNGEERRGVAVRFSTSDARIAAVDAFGNVAIRGLGRFSLWASAPGVEASVECEAVPSPVASVTLRADRHEGRTGDVFRFAAEARDRLGRIVPEAPVAFSVVQDPTEESVSRGPAAVVDRDGRFVAEEPGFYTVVASSGGRAAQVTVRVATRDVRQRIEVVGRGIVREYHTSDLWVWEGVDGRDYAVTGTWGANGEAYFWDVTEPEKITKVGTIKVDARTVNDVKVSEDGRICVISREGASNRRNGIVIYDVTDPRNAKQLSSFDDGLTGGVHNVFIHAGHIYAINNMRRYDVIRIEDPAKPFRVSRFELEAPGHSVHDVWVFDGIAYSSNFRHGLYLVDVGNGIAGGSPDKPVEIDHYQYPESIVSHSAFPYFSEDARRFYVIVGEELFPRGLFIKEKPTIPAGYLHFLDFTVPGQPREVARYEVPEAGSHNFWVDGDVLYVAYYNGGLRVVDISGELMGDLYRQGREIAEFRPYDAKGVVPNAAMTWGPQPYKGLVYFSDWNSGLWAVRLVSDRGRRRGGATIAGRRTSDPGEARPGSRGGGAGSGSRQPSATAESRRTKL